MQNLPEQVGQLLIVGFEGSGWNQDLAKLLQTVRPGGVIFFQRNIMTSNEFQQLVAQVRTSLESPASPPPFLAMDLEGGLVDRLREALSPLPSASDATRAGLGREQGQIAGRELAAFALNVNFAPVLDLETAPSRIVLGSRTAGKSPKPVIRFAEQFLEGLAGQGILGCGKHFPGLGSGEKDSHLALPRIAKPEAEMWETDLVPFRTLASQLPMIMVAHACYPELERALAPAGADVSPLLPASLSPNLVSGLLKERIGFAGLVLSDDLEMGGVLEGRSIEEAAVAALRAGCDVLLVCRKADNVRRVYEALQQEAERNPEFRFLVEKAAQKVLRARQTLLPPRQPGGGERFSDWDALRRDIRQLTTEIQQRLSSSSSRREATEE